MLMHIWIKFWRNTFVLLDATDIERNAAKS